jgi:serpin B
VISARSGNQGHGTTVENDVNRRLFLTLLAAPAVIQLLPSCGSDRRAADDTPGGGSAAEQRSGLARTPTSAADATAAVGALNAFGAELLDLLVAGAPTANVVCSPASIAIALTMTSAGAKGATLAAMDAALHIADPATIHHSMNALSAALAGRTQSVGKDSVRLDVANSLWGQRGMVFEQPFLDILATEYGAGMRLVDYLEHADDARKQINAWVDERTEQRIPELIPEGVLDTLTRLTLVNAVYLDATWRTVFTKEATRPATFTLAGGAGVQVPTMHQTLTCGYAEGPGWQAVDLAYAFDELSMTVVVPQDGTVAVPSVAEVVAALSPTEVSLSLPKFEIGSSIELSEALGSLGMGLAFSDDADFTGMTTADRLKIAAVIHQANITVDEEGTEAAAATAVVMIATSAPIKPAVVVAVDRPFGFALRDVPTGAIVFYGRVADPSLTRR